MLKYLILLVEPRRIELPTSALRIHGAFLYALINQALTVRRHCKIVQFKAILTPFLPGAGLKLVHCWGKIL